MGLGCSGGLKQSGNRNRPTINVIHFINGVYRKIDIHHNRTRTQSTTPGTLVNKWWYVLCMRCDAMWWWCSKATRQHCAQLALDTARSHSLTRSLSRSLWALNFIMVYIFDLNSHINEYVLSSCNFLHRNLCFISHVSRVFLSISLCLSRCFCFFTRFILYFGAYFCVFGSFDLLSFVRLILWLKDLFWILMVLKATPAFWIYDPSAEDG